MIGLEALVRAGARGRRVTASCVLGRVVLWLTVAVVC